MPFTEQNFSFGSTIRFSQANAQSSTDAQGKQFKKPSDLSESRLSLSWGNYAKFGLGLFNGDKTLSSRRRSREISETLTSAVHTFSAPSVNKQQTFKVQDIR